MRERKEGHRVRERKKEREATGEHRRQRAHTNWKQTGLKIHHTEIFNLLTQKQPQCNHIYAPTVETATARA